jgi:hypothetical protein
MYTNTHTVEHRAFIRVTVFAILMLGIAGCASELPIPGGPATKAPYVGIFTGEFVDGRPLYRLPPIEVVGSRRGVTDLDGS